MKEALHILKLGLLTVLFSCGQKDEKQQISVLSNDTLNTSIDKSELERLENGAEIDAKSKSDSIILHKILSDAIDIAEQNELLGRFEKKYVETMPDSSYQVEVSISCDFFFAKQKKHYIIRRNTPGSIYIDIFSKTHQSLQKVLSHEQWDMTYVNDTIRDINGDGLKDFVVNWYGSTGCCLKAFSNVYLLRPDKKTFSSDFEFINPTFSPREKVIRGVCYGHPGQTEMYKYKWNGERVDTLEYISYEKSNKGVKTGKIIVSNNKPYGQPYKILKRLNSAPDDYKKIEGYGWFIGAEYN